MRLQELRPAKAGTPTLNIVAIGTSATEISAGDQREVSNLVYDDGSAFNK